MSENQIEVKKKITDFPKNEENPFVKDMINDMEPAKRLKMVRPDNREVIQTLVNSDSGEVTGHTAFMQYVEVDERQFAKIYLSQMAAFWELSKPAIRVFTYVMSVVTPNHDKFIFFIDDCVKYTKYKAKSMVFDGLADLLEAKIIARGRTQFEYFINPLVVFNGNRITFAKTYIRKKIKDNQQNDNQLNLFGDIERRDFKSLKKIAGKNNLLTTEDSEQEDPAL